jgi:tetratricopeptide (TPR) repeat protein
VALAAASVVSSAAPAARADAYDDAMARAARREAAGDLDGAAGELELLLGFDLYPQDVELPSRLGALHLRRGRWLDAERAYRLALTRSPKAVDPLAGLAVAVARQGRCDESSLLFARVLGAAPDHPVRAEASAPCVPPQSLWVTPGLSVDGLFYRAGTRRAAVGGSARVDVEHASGLFAGGTYRFLEFFGRSTSTLSAWSQNEGHFRLGWASPRFGAALRYAVVADGSQAIGDSHHGGLDLRWSPFGDVALASSVSVYDDLTVLRFEPSWRIPIAWGLSIRPAMSVQWTKPYTYIGASATAHFERGPVQVWAGGKGGPEMRPAYMTLDAIYNLKEEIEFGFWAGGSVNAGKGVRIHLRYSMDRLEGAATSRSTTRANGAARTGSTQDVHALSLAVSKTF